jgi:LuxR family maltose regulon positive regulatory protein
MVLVLDDLHAVSRPACIDVLAALLEYVPESSQVAIASREEPALPLARWRAQGRVHVFGVNELRLDDREAGQLLKAAGTDLDAASLAELTAHTEGWPAGLYLAALSQRVGASPAAITDVAGDDRFVSDYFRLEILSRLPPEQARFLKYTSVLERMSGGLCDAVLETAGSAIELERLERTNCFVVPLDRRGEWYRYHHLFGELLRTELDRSEPGAVASLNARAMAWCVANDRPEEAIAYAHAAGATDTLAGLLDSLVLPLHYDGRTETVDDWLRWFTDDDLMRYPALAVYGAWIRALTGRSAEAERWLGLADGASSAIPLSDGSATIGPWVATLRAHMMRDGVEQALADAELALEQLPAGSPWVPTAQLARGVAHAQLALLEAGKGAWGQAGLRARAAQAVVDEAGLGDLSSSALAHVATARVAFHDGRLEDARAALTRTHRLRPLLDHPFHG